VTLSALIDGALEFARVHNKSVQGYECKAKIVRAALGSRAAEEITPEELDRWIFSHCKTPATLNRYRAFFSLCYREGQRNRKVDVNPARLVRPRRENNARLRFLSREEYDKLAAIIQKDHPQQLPSFVVSVFTGMRLTEQFTLSWVQVDFDRRLIRLTNTKNGSARNFPLNSNEFQVLAGHKTISMSARYAHSQHPRQSVWCSQQGLPDRTCTKQAPDEKTSRS
jgi:integrase